MKKSPFIYPIYPHPSCSQKSLQAKQPASLFDLDALEAYEKILLTPTGNVSGDEDNNLNRFSDGLEHEVLEEPDVDRSSFIYHEIPERLHMKRVDAVIAALEPKLSRSTCGNLVTDGHVFLVKQSEQRDEKNKINTNTEVPITRKSEKVSKGQTLKIIYKKEELPTEIIPENIPLEILYEDEHMIVVNKVAGMVVHPAAGNWDGTLVNALAYYLANSSPYGSGEFVNIKNAENHEQNEQNINAMPTEKDAKDGEIIYFRPGIVHRLDKGTTGVIVVAKTKAALANLSESFAERRVKKTYVAITIGNPGKRVKIDKPIGRHPIHRQKMRVVPDPGKKNSNGYSLLASNGLPSPSIAGRRALSYVDTKAFDGKLSVVEVRIETGRTHQIRVHLQDRHTPIYGDDVYGLSDWNKILSKKYKIARPLLHAHRLEMDHPVTGEHMTFIAPMANDMKTIATKIWPQGMDERPELFVGRQVD